MLFTLTPYILTNPPAPGTKEWRTTITASKVPPMIRNNDGTYAGHGYISAWEQYQEIKGELIQEPSAFMLKRFAKAHAAEQPAAEWWIAQQDNPDEWELSDGEVAYHNPAYPFFGFVTLDFVATHTPTGEQTVLEVKNPDKGGLQAGWAIQHIAQRAISGITNGGIIVWPIAGAAEWHPIDASPQAIQAVMDDVEHFATRCNTNNPPAGGDLTLDDTDIDALTAAKEALTQAKAELDKVQAAIAAKIGDHKRATYNGKAIATRQAGKFAKGRIPKEYAPLTKAPEFLTTTEKFDEKKFAAAHPDIYNMAVDADSFKFL